MKAVFIPYNQAQKERLIDILDRMSIRGFTMWEHVQGRGSNTGDPHYGSHAWPTMNSAILTVIPDEKAEDLLRRIHALDIQTEQQGIHAFVWSVEEMV